MNQGEKPAKEKNVQILKEITTLEFGFSNGPKDVEIGKDRGTGGSRQCDLKCSNHEQSCYNKREESETYPKLR